MAGNAQAQGPWDWLSRSALEVGCVMVFARDVEQDEMFEAFGLDPTAAQTEEYVFESGRRRVRMGRVEPWTFAVDETAVSLERAARGRNVGKWLSQGTEAVVVTWTAKPTESFEYWADGVRVTAFEPYRPVDRFGSDPDRFLREMRQVGMIADPDDDDPSGGSLISVLDMATLALGIRLSEGAAMGPLATVTLPGSGPVIQR